MDNVPRYWRFSCEQLEHLGAALNISSAPVSKRFLQPATGTYIIEGELRPGLRHTCLLIDSAL